MCQGQSTDSCQEQSKDQCQGQPELTDVSRMVKICVSRTVNVCQDMCVKNYQYVSRTVRISVKDSQYICQGEGQICQGQCETGSQQICVKDSLHICVQDM